MNFMIRKFEFLRVLMAVVILAMVPAAYAQQIMPLGPYGQIPVAPIASTSLGACAGASGTVALLPGQMSTIAMTVQTGALICTTPTATQLCALFSAIVVNGSPFHWDWYLANGGTGTVTAALGSGVTNAGGFYTSTLTVAAGSVRHFIININGCQPGGTPAAQLYSLGTSVF